MKIRFQHIALSYRDPLNGNYDENINEEGVIICDGEYQVCGCCNGKGYHFRRDLDENNLVSIMEEDGDEDGLDRYYGGSFDETCSTCKGLRVVQSPRLPEWASKLLSDYYEWERKDRAYAEAERRMGA